MPTLLQPPDYMNVVNCAVKQMFHLFLRVFLSAQDELKRNPMQSIQPGITGVRARYVSSPRMAKGVEGGRPWPPPPPAIHARTPIRTCEIN